MLQSAVNLGILFAALFVALLQMLPHPPPERWVFLIGVAPALLVFWIRKRVPESDEWQEAQRRSPDKPGLRRPLPGRDGAGHAGT